MNGQIKQPHDKGRTNETPHQNEESTMNGMEIKQEPSVKLEPNDPVLVMVPGSERAASGSIVNLIGGEQGVDTYDFTDIYILADDKSELKKEKVEKEAKNDSAVGSGKKRIGSPSLKDAKNRGKHPKFKPGSIGSKKTKNCVTKKPIKPNTNIRSDKKKPTATKEKGKKHKCLSCDYTFLYKSRLIRHIRKHTGEKPFPCTHCEKRFTHKHHLQSHMRSHVSEFLFSCSNCLKEFSQNDEKVEHEIGCKIRRFECHLCKEYSTFVKSNLEYHMRVQHTGEKPFGCDRCSKKFTKQIALIRYQKSHINPRPLKFKCSVCYRNFSEPIGNDEHESKCKRRGYECCLCKEYMSPKLYLLAHHMRTHTGLKPFQCKMCQKSFSQKSTLKRHEIRSHK